MGTQPLLREQATETTIKQRIAQARYIHFATHGLLDEEQGLDSAIALTPSPEDDGFLKVKEIINLNLNAELAVLSACDTGRGRITGDGVIGLSRSFISSGVSSVIVSLWRVGDESTAELMKKFYGYLVDDGKDKAQALRLAMIDMLKTNPNPKQWAAFTLIGETF